MGPSDHFYSFSLYMDPVWSLLIVGTGCHVIGTCCILGRAPRTKETLPDFLEWCRVTRHPRIFRGLTGYQRTPRFWGVTYLSIFQSYNIYVFFFLFFISNVCK